MSVLEPPLPLPAAPPPVRVRTARAADRVGLHLVLAALPLLCISSHVFGLVPMHVTALALVVPLASAAVALHLFAPHAVDGLLVRGVVWGAAACAVYDTFRLVTVYLFGWWGDFIPRMGTWIVGDPTDLSAGAVVGYLWRYAGDAGGIGLTFFVLAATVGLHRRSRAVIVAAAVGFAVFPVWSGLIATVALAPRGQALMFALTPTTLTLSLIGHLIFGVVLGLGLHRSRTATAPWPWSPPIRDATLPRTEPAAARVRAWAAAPRHARERVID